MLQTSWSALAALSTSLSASGSPSAAVPALALIEAAIFIQNETAALLVPRFGLLTYGQRLVPVYREDGTLAKLETEWLANQGAPVLAP